MISPTNTDYAETIEVADDFELPPIAGQDDWLEIETVDGGQWAIPMRYVVAVVLEPPEKKKSKRRAKS